MMKYCGRIFMVASMFGATIGNAMEKDPRKIALVLCSAQHAKLGQFSPAQLLDQHVAHIIMNFFHEDRNLLLINEGDSKIIVKSAEQDQFYQPHEPVINIALGAAPYVVVRRSRAHVPATTIPHKALVSVPLKTLRISVYDSEGVQRWYMARLPIGQLLAAREVRITQQSVRCITDPDGDSQTLTQLENSVSMLPVVNMRYFYKN